MNYKTIILLVISSICLFACNEKNNNQLMKKVYTSKEGIIYESYFDNSGNKQGKERVYYSNGAIANIGNYRNGLKEGRFIQYEPVSEVNRESKIIRIAYFSNNLPNGRYFEFYTNGNVKRYSNYIKGKPVGFTYFFDINNNLIQKHKN